MYWYCIDDNAGCLHSIGERPSEYDFFLKPDESDKPPVGARPSLKNLGWDQ